MSGRHLKQEHLLILTGLGRPLHADANALMFKYTALTGKAKLLYKLGRLH
jgi:hypothetical protein